MMVCARQELYQTAIEFLKLEKAELGGVRGNILGSQLFRIYEEVSELSKSFADCKYDPLDPAEEVSEWYGSVSKCYMKKMACQNMLEELRVKLPHGSTCARFGAGHGASGFSESFRKDLGRKRRGCASLNHFALTDSN